MPLEEPETPIWCKLCVADHEKRKSDGSLVLHHAVVLFCPVQLSAWRKTTFSPSLEEIVVTTHDVVSTFAALSCFVSEEIHLPWQSLAVHTKYSALS